VLQCSSVIISYIGSHVTVHTQYSSSLSYHDILISVLCVEFVVASVFAWMKWKWGIDVTWKLTCRVALKPLRYMMLLYWHNCLTSAYGQNQN